MSAEEIRTTDSYTRMDIVDLRAINDGAKVEALQEVLRDTEDQWAEVQTALKANQLFEQELSKRSIQTDRIIAATMDAAGVVAVYLR